MKRSFEVALIAAFACSFWNSMLEADAKKPAPQPTPAQRVAPPPERPKADTTARAAPSATTNGPNIEGRYGYTIRGDSYEAQVRRLNGDFYSIRSSEGWEGVGIFDGSTYRGVFRRRGADPKTGTSTGDHAIDWRTLDDPVVRMVLDGAPSEERQSWRRLQDPVPTSSSDSVKFGDYTYVEELPEAITRPSPSYPDAARQSRIEGTVMVQALVRTDGTVGDTKIVKSIPELDAAAVASVRQWVFKPALTNHMPVAVWVVVPVKFTLP